MRRTIFVPVLLALALVSTQPAAGTVPAPPKIDAPAYYVINAASGDVLMSKSPDEQRAIASVTKLMTVDVALQHLSLDQYVTVSNAAAETGEESAGLHAGEQISVSDLVLGALVQSANDAADALADAASGDNRALFASWMNAEAKQIGLTNSHFVRPDGLDAPGEYSSARDVTKFARWAMDLPVVRQAVRMSTATISGGRRLFTWDDLLGVFPGVVGVKTGHTDDAGWCQVALLQRDGLDIYATILGSPNRQRRDRDLAAMLRYALASYRVATVIRAGQPITTVGTAYGRGDVPLAASGSLSAPVRLGRPLVEKIVLPSRLALPVEQGQHVGKVRVYSGGKLLGERDLVATRSVSKPGLLGKLGWYGSRTAHNLFGWI